MKKSGIFALFLLLFSSVYSQKTEFTNLVFEGGGIRGIVYAGVIEVLEEEGYINQVEKVAGTSVGAITALMISLNYSSDEITTIISKTKFQQFNEIGIHRLNSHYGWYQHNNFMKWLDKIIENKTGEADITFQEMHNRGYKDLYITSTCLNQQKLIVFSYENYPQMKVKDAVKASMSIPLYFEAVFIDSLGRIYDKKVDTIPLDVMVDGGILGNYPIFIFDSVTISPSGQEIRIPNYKTLGIRIDSENQIKNDSTNQELATIPIDNLADYFTAFYILIMENLNRQILIPQDWERTISVSSVGIGPRLKYLTKAQKEKLIESGRKSTQAYFENES